jgi:hypothetical protein
MTVFSEVVRTGGEIVVAYFEVLSGYLPEGTVENLSQDKSPG